MRSLLKAVLCFFLITPAWADFTIKSDHGEGDTCRLRGRIKSRNPRAANTGIHAIRNHIRMSFKADDAHTCERIIQSYCENNILEKNHAVVDLKGMYRPKDAKDKKPTHNYTVTENCKLIIE